MSSPSSLGDLGYQVSAVCAVHRAPSVAVIDLQRRDVLAELLAREPTINHAVEQDQDGKAHFLDAFGVLYEIDAVEFRRAGIIGAAGDLDKAAPLEALTVSVALRRVAECRRKSAGVVFRQVRIGADFVDWLHSTARLVIGRR